MWTYLSDWLVQDGEIPELAAGDRLADVALRAAFWTIRESREPSRATLCTGPDPAGEITTHYELTGTTERVWPPNASIVQVGNVIMLAEPKSVRPVPGTGGALERFSEDCIVPPVGVWVTATARVEVMAHYETEDLDYPKLRQDWLVEGVKLERREFVRTGVHSVRPGPIAALEEIGRMRRWADQIECQHLSYLVDLVPAQHGSL